MQLIERLSKYHPKVIDLSLSRIERILNLLGNPENRLPPVIHIAGTNGKGSTLAFIRAIAEAAGLNVHTYTSPHLVKFNERIRINGNIIEDETLMGLVEEVEIINGSAPITFFELTTAVALLAFHRTPADLVLLETGLGGRLDATNVIKRPAVTILSPISYDHIGFLGNNLADIATEKAGIMKTGTVCITSKQEPIVLDTIRRVSDDINVPLKVENEDWWISILGDKLLVNTYEGKLKLPFPRLLGRHQLHNAGLATVALAALGDKRVTENALRQGMKTVDWPGRMQSLTVGPFSEMLPEGWELWLDGGHNPAAGEAIAGTIEAQGVKPVYLIIGMLKTKNPTQFLEPLVPYISEVRTIRVLGEEASMNAHELCNIAVSLGLNAYASENILEAISQIVNTQQISGKILICGSLYLAGAVLRENS